MPTPGVSMRKIKTILQLHFESKLSQHQIASSVQLSVGALNKYIKLAIEAGLNWPLPPNCDNQASLQARLKAMRKGRIITPRHVIDFVYIHQELQRKSVTLQLLWEEYN